MIMHAELKINNFIFCLCDPMEPGCSIPKDTPLRIGLHLSVENSDALHDQAVSASCEATMLLMDPFWDDPFGQIKDPYRHTWSIADLTREQIQKGAIDYFKNLQAQ